MNVIPFVYARAQVLVCALKKISAMHVIKLGFAPKAYPPGQHRKTSTVNDKMYYAINSVC